ncbi:uncharacterized protein LOC120292470 [Eucalyptus grandis]|uniref:uncharacterized protein LOC120292470 n=1 Tax=Eucalyptus grandis TaxID=71139 RepID=UPI00192EF7B4|nr:uncharacterized protein LOC120292470 [Eucalyptus grandis]
MEVAQVKALLLRLCFGRHPPDPQSLKINIDGAFTPASFEGSVASITRDHYGRIVDGFTSRVNASLALQTETQALNLTLRNLLQKGQATQPLTLESDCQILVDAVNNLCSTPWEIRALLNEVATLIPAIPNLRITYCRREANEAANWTARAHNSESLPPSWPTTIPPLFGYFMY